MKRTTLSLAILLALTVPALADSAAPAETAKSAEGVAATMWDFTRNPEYLKDPKKFVGWLSAALEPSFYTSGLGMQMLDPAMWGVMANSMMHPATYSAWMPLMTDPNIYMKWLTASMDPNFYNAVLSQFSDTGKMMRWVASPADPKTLNLALQTLNPAMYLKWMTAPLDPNWVQAMIAPINPATYLGWTGAVLNPASYGELWKGFLAPSSSFAAFTPSTANPLDPNAWNKLWQVPAAPVAK